MSDNDQTVDELLEGLQAWLQTQPAWGSMLAGSREDRKEAARLVTKLLLFQDSLDVTPQGRAVRRAVSKLFKAELGEQKERLSKVRQRHERDAGKARTRFGRMSRRRFEQVAAARIAKDEELRKRLAEYQAHLSGDDKDGNKEATNASVGEEPVDRGAPQEEVQAPAGADLVGSPDH
jgi:hypothetical protein